MKVAQVLWNANISAEYSHLDNPKFKRQLDEALERGIPYMVVFGPEEVANGVLKVKNMKAHTEVEVPYQRVVEELLSQGCFALTAAAHEASFLESMKALDDPNAAVKAAAIESATPAPSDSV